MKKIKLFVSFPVTSSVSNAIKKTENGIIENIEHFEGKSFKFSSFTNWHITLTFLGYQDEILLHSIVDVLKETSNKFIAPEIIFDKIDYDSSFLNEKKQNSRMIWLHINKESSKNISEIKNFLDSSLEARGISFQKENKLFIGHITLARLGDKINNQELPEIEKVFQLSYFPESINLMESTISHNEIEYNSLQSFDLDLQ